MTSFKSEVQSLTAGASELWKLPFLQPDRVSPRTALGISHARRSQPIDGWVYSKLGAQNPRRRTFLELQARCFQLLAPCPCPVAPSLLYSTCSCCCIFEGYMYRPGFWVLDCNSATLAYHLLLWPLADSALCTYFVIANCFCSLDII